MQNFFKTIKLWYLITLKYFTRHYIVFIGIILLIISSFFIQSKFDLLQTRTQVLSEGLVGTYQEHDIPLEVLRLLSRGLVRSDPEGRMVPDIAEGWEINNDATIFKLKLKDDVYWIDESKIKSTDLEFGIPNVETTFPDDRIVQFKLKESYSPFPSLLTKPIFKKGTLIGVGPYKIEKLEKSRVFITKLLLKPLEAGLPDIVIRFYPNEKTAWIGFYLGEVQTLLGITQIDNLNGFPLAKLKQETDYTKIVTIMYDTSDNVLANRSLRQSLSYSAPQIADEQEAKGPIPPFSWAYSNEAKDYLSNTEEAKAALERAKATASEESLKEEMILTTIPQLEEVAKKIIASWRDLGINAVLRTESGIPQKFQALLITQSIPLDPDQYSLWHKTQTQTNITKYDKARADKDLEDGRKLIKEEDRREKYIDFQKVLLEDSPATFLYFPKYNVIYVQKAEDKLNQVFALQFNNLGKKI